jgi:hypothetical protein
MSDDELFYTPGDSLIGTAPTPRGGGQGGARIDMPPIRQPSVPFKRGRKAKGNVIEQPKMFGADDDEERPF